MYYFPATAEHCTFYKWCESLANPRLPSFLTDPSQNREFFPRLARKLPSHLFRISQIPLPSLRSLQKGLSASPTSRRSCDQVVGDPENLELFLHHCQEQICRQTLDEKALARHKSEKEPMFVERHLFTVPRRIFLWVPWHAGADGK